MAKKRKIVKEKIHPDLTKIENTVGERIEHLVTSMDKYKNFNSLKTAFLEIIEDPKTKISTRKRKEYKLNLENMHSLPRVRNFILNVYMKSANLGLS